MLNNFMRVANIRDYFINELKAGNITVDRGKNETIEMIGASFLADEPAIFGTPNEDYIRRELDWYESQSTNVNDIEGDTPAAWVSTGNKHGEINSNYGHLIWSDKYFNQYKNCVEELYKNPNSRRAQMIYNRPSIWLEAFENGKNDFICTNAVTYYVRNDQVHCVVQMRSNDVIFGYRNDYAWQKYVLDKLTQDLNYTYTTRFKADQPPFSVGNIYWQVMNLHVYGRHFHLVK
jgi:thymidylate synthase